VVHPHASGRLLAIDEPKSQMPSMVEVTVRPGFRPSAVNGKTYRVSVRFAVTPAPGSAAVGVASWADATNGPSVINAEKRISRRRTTPFLPLGTLPLHISVDLGI
jgi:hypothetical protein